MGTPSRRGVPLNVPRLAARNRQFWRWQFVLDDHHKSVTIRLRTTGLLHTRLFQHAQLTMSCHASSLCWALSCDAVIQRLARLTDFLINSHRQTQAALHT